MALSTELTGRTRYRVEQRFMRKPVCVLQIEERVFGRNPSAQFQEFTDQVDYTKWRDATPEDLTTQPRNKP